MAYVKRVTFKNADNAPRKGAIRAFSKMVDDLHGYKRSGDYIEIEMDDGTIFQQRFAGPQDQDHPHKKSHTKHQNDEGLDFHLMPGTEP